MHSRCLRRTRLGEARKGLQELQPADVVDPSKPENQKKYAETLQQPKEPLDPELLKRVPGVKTFAPSDKYIDKVRETVTRHMRCRRKLRQCRIIVKC